MKLQKRLSRRVGKKEYAKWIITIPPAIVEKLAWNADQELEAQISESNLIIKKSEKTNNLGQRPTD